MAASIRRFPVVAILGCTGTGKSKLALELAAQFKGEIISADSIQVYKGLDIITNKVTPEERELCPHHMIDYLDPLEFTSTVIDFQQKAIPIIERIQQENKMPIIVGGTNYYIESLLWKFLLGKRKGNGSDEDEGLSGKFPKLDAKISPSIERSSYFLSQSSSSQCSEPLSDVDNKTSSGLCTEQLLANKVDNVDSKPSNIKSEREQGDNSSDSSCCCQQLNPDTQISACDSAKSSEKQNEVTILKSEEDTVESVRECESCDVLKQDEAKCENNDLILTADDFAHNAKDGVYASYKTEVLYDMLIEVDVQTAQATHPCDRRKIIRALQVYDIEGTRKSELLDKQHQEVGGDAISGPLRYPFNCVLWIQCDKEVLNERLDKRVDSMMDKGLLNELLDFHEKYNKTTKDRKSIYTSGIFQSIGFKEFHNYLILSEEERNSENGKKLLKEGLEQMKLVTRRYAKKQVKWIKNRLLRRPGSAVPEVYGLDGTDLSKWEENVYDPALNILTDMCEGRKPSIESLPMEEKITFKEYNVCTSCGGRVFVTKLDWEAHLRSRKHRNTLHKIKRMEAKEEDKLKVKTEQMHRTAEKHRATWYV